MVSVSDNGCGIPAEELPKIFDRFYRVDASRDRETGGYGLGLSIAFKVAAQHAGSLTVSNGGRGAVFRLTIPKTVAS